MRCSLFATPIRHNTTWLIERHGFITPAAARQKRLQPAALAA
jgi:putative transposase